MSVVRTQIALLIPAFSLLLAPPVLTVWLLCEENAPLPYPCYKDIPRFGIMLEPRYVVGAHLLDQ